MHHELSKERVELFSRGYAVLTEEIGKRIVGYRAVVDQVLTAMMAGGNVLLEGVPGLGKTLLVRTIGEATQLQFHRIQFTPDLMPADITGTNIIHTDDKGGRTFRFQPGPVFANLVLADEINRATPKTQSAVLEAMQEGCVTVGGSTHRLPDPFWVLATQNPIEMEGTYVLPEAQADRFMFSIHCGYPSNSEEELVVRNTTGTQTPELTPVLDGKAILQIQKLVRAMPISDEVVRYAVRLVASTRPEDPASPAYVKEFIRWGASPRASQYLVLGAKARAAVLGKLCADYEGVKSVARQVLRHRLITNFNARSQKVTVKEIIEKILADVSPSAGIMSRTSG